MFSVSYCASGSGSGSGTVNILPLTVQVEVDEDRKNKEDDHEDSLGESSKVVVGVACQEEQTDEAEVLDVKTSKDLVEGGIVVETGGLANVCLVVDPEHEVFVGDVPEGEGQEGEAAHKGGNRRVGESDDDIQTLTGEDLAVGDKWHVTSDVEQAAGAAAHEDDLDVVDGEADDLEETAGGASKAVRDD